MRGRVLTAVAAVAACAAVARADTQVLARAGIWQAFGGTTTNGLGVCGLSASPGGKYFGLKQFADYSTFTIQVGGPGWPTQDAAKYRVTMQLDARNVWTATATGMRFNDGDPGLEFTIRKEELSNFVGEFLTSRAFRLQFPGSGLAEWTLPLTGATTVFARFQQCIERMR